jgi:hypothetical protein
VVTSVWRPVAKGALVALGLAAALGGVAPGAPPPDLDAPEVKAALAGVDTAAIAAHVRFLADDLLEGRGTGTRGHEIAARYVAARFRALRLEPAGDAGSYFQRVPLRHAWLAERGGSLALVRRGRVERLRFEDDFVMSADAARESSAVTARLVFAGYGVTAPELGYNDFAGLDARGAIAVVLSGAPPTFPNDQRAHYSKGSIKEENLARHGVVGVLTVRTPWDAKRAPWERVVRQSRQGVMRWLDARGVPQEVFPQLKVMATLHDDAARRLFATARRPIDSVFAAAQLGRPGTFGFDIEGRLARRSAHRLVSSPNVVGRLAGSDSRLVDEVVVYSAHLDHLGITTPVRGDSINNGALDNASGVACLLEVAAAFARGPRPRRSIVFLAVTGEERGLQGAEYFAAHPVVPVERIVADINLDMLLMLFPLRDVVAIGAEHSSLADPVRRAAAVVGFEVSPDPTPDEVVFVRSDQYAFVRRGVPSVFVVGGQRSRDPSRQGAEICERWRHTVYHTPQDDLSQSFDYGSAQRFARLNYLVGHQVANRSERPTWNAGDFFGATFGGAAR